MKVREYCRDCLKNLAEQVVGLSGGGDSLLESSIRLIDSLFSPAVSPTHVSNRLLRYVRQQTGAYDPYAERKRAEFARASDAFRRLKDFFPPTLEGALHSSAFGNGGDFFVDDQFDTDGFEFAGDVAKIADRVYISRKILMLGDNLSDFLFDLPLVNLLKRGGKDVFYAIKEHPIQNDMSVPDIEKFGADKLALTSYRPVPARWGSGGRRCRVL